MEDDKKQTKSARSTSRKSITAAKGRATLAIIANQDVEQVWRSSPAHIDGQRLNDDQLQFALDRLAAGVTMASVCDDLGISRSTLWLRARRDPDFCTALLQARSIGAHQVRDHARSIVMGDEEFSTGSIERDKLAWDYMKFIMRADNPTTYGDKATVQADTIVVNLANQTPDDFS